MRTGKSWAVGVAAIIVASVGLLAAAAGADGQLQGRVLDPATGQAVAGATITVADRQAVSDARGRFELSAPEGDWTVNTTAPGYAD